MLRICGRWTRGGGVYDTRVGNHMLAGMICRRGADEVLCAGGTLRRLLKEVLCAGGAFTCAAGGMYAGGGDVWKCMWAGRCARVEKCMEMYAGGEMYGNVCGRGKFMRAGRYM